MWQKCVSPDVLGLTHFLFFERKVIFFGNRRSVFGDGACEQAHAAVRHPRIISLLVGALYNIVDQIFIANASYLGSYGNAANTVVFPLTVVASVTPCSKKCAIIFLKTSLFHLVFAAKTVVYV